MIVTAHLNESYLLDHSNGWHPFQAVTDGDQFEKAGSRVLLHDEELWPMAKGVCTLCNLHKQHSQFSSFKEQTQPLTLQSFLRVSTWA